MSAASSGNAGAMKSQHMDANTYWVEVTLDNSHHRIPYHAKEITLRKSYCPPGDIGSTEDQIKIFTIGSEKFSQALKIIEKYLQREKGEHEINTKVDLKMANKSFTIIWSFDTISFPESNNSLISINHGTSSESS